MYLLFDIGGSKMRVAFTSNGQTLDEFRVVPTPNGFEEGMGRLNELANEVRHGAAVQKVAGGIAGILNKEKDALYKSPHLTEWAGKPLKERLSQMFVADVTLENDSALVGLGEAIFGAAKGFRIVAYMTVSTGIGGTRIVDGKIDPSIYGFEPGHQIVDADGTMFPNFNPGNTDMTKGEFESLASGFAIEQRFGHPSYDLNDDSAWGHINWLIAQGLCNSILHWSPEVVVIGGGVTESDKFSFDTIKGHLREVLKVYPELPEIRKAQLGDLGGLHGGMALLNSLK